MLCCVTKGRDCGTLDTGGEAMNAVGKNLKQLRQREKLTQDALAERLHVTRQAVSSLAEALNADVRELIYGPGRIERPYARFQRRYIICTAVCVLVFLAWIVMELTLEPYLAELLGKGYIVWPIFVYGVTVSLFAYSAGGVFLPAVISLWGDIRLRSNRLRRTMAVLGLLFLSHYVLWASVLLLGNTWYPILRDWFYWLLNLPFARNGTLFLSGCLLFLSLNK